jgi:hypothetical protein
MGGLNQSLLARNASSQPQERCAFIAHRFGQNAVFDTIQLAGALLRGLADRVSGGDKQAFEQRRAIFERCALFRLVFNRHSGARCVVARRQEELRPQGETQIRRLHSRRLVFVPEIVECSPQGFASPVQPRMAILG